MLIRSKRGNDFCGVFILYSETKQRKMRSGFENENLYGKDQREKNSFEYLTIRYGEIFDCHAG